MMCGVNDLRLLTELTRPDGDCGIEARQNDNWRMTLSLLRTPSSLDIYQMHDPHCHVIFL